MREHVTRPRSMVLPVKICKRLEELPVNRASRKSKIYYRTHGLDLAFALTFHKFQGQTVDKIILDLSKTPKNVFNLLCFQAFYVGMMRVKKSSCIRILPGPDGRKPKLSHLLTLKPDPELQRWLDAFDRGTREWKQPPPVKLKPRRKSAKKAQPNSRGDGDGAAGDTVMQGRQGRGGRGRGKSGARATKGSQGGRG